MISDSSIHVKFSTISSGFYPVHYAFYIELKDEILIKKEIVSTKVWDNNLIIQLPFDSSKTIESYLVGLTPYKLEEKFIDDPTPSTSTVPDENPPENSESQQNNQFSRKKCKHTKNVQIETEKLNEDENKPQMSKTIDIAGTTSESSCDELGYSYSPSKSKGILKRFSTSRSSVSRSISESSIDDVFWASSFENCHTSLDSVIPEDGEISSSLKKTVRFSDVVLKQLYRSNSSILGQKKKNQRKARNKKRAHERRHSESELSELDELKERDSKTNEEGVNNEGTNNDAEEDVDEEADGNAIFDLDI